MIAASNLIWIIPVCVLAGLLIMGFIVGATLRDREFDAYQQGIKHGKKMIIDKYGIIEEE